MYRWAQLFRTKRFGTRRICRPTLCQRPNASKFGISYNLDSEDPDVADVAKAELSLSGHLASADISRWQSTGKVVSEPDLRGATIVLAFSPVGASEELQTIFARVRSALELRSINLRVNSRNIWLKADRLEKYVGDDGNPFWVIRLSKDDPFSEAKAATQAGR